MMTSRERVLKACNFEEPDRVPIDIGGSQVTGIHIDHYVELIKHLGIEHNVPKVYEQFEMLARVEEPIREVLHSDIISLENPVMRFGIENKDFKEWATQVGHVCMVPGGFNPVEDKNGDLWIKDSKGNNIAHMAKNSLYFDFATPTTMTNDIKLADVKSFKRNLPVFCDKHLMIIQKAAKELYKNTDYAVLGEFGKGSLGTNNLFAGHTITDWLTLLILEPAYCADILSAATEVVLENVKLYLEAVGNNIDIVLVSGTDFGTQRAELFNPNIWKELYMPNYQKINEYIHKNSSLKTFMHTCGSVVNLIDYIIEADFDILNPIQVSADNMNPEMLKERFGGRIVFWGGGVDTQNTLQFGTVDEVISQVIERLKIFSPGGGYIFNPIHCIQYGVPPENIIAAADTAFKYGVYK